MDTPITEPMDRVEAAINAERLINEAIHAEREGQSSFFVDRLLREAQVYATLSTRPYNHRS